MEAKHISLTPDREYLNQQAQKSLQEFIARQKPTPWLIVEIARLPPLLKIWLQAFLNEDCENEQRKKETSVLLKVAQAAEKIFKKYGVNSLQEWKILLFARMQFDGDSLYSRVYDTDLARIFSYGEDKFQVAGRYSECLEIIKETGLYEEDDEQKLLLFYFTSLLRKIIRHYDKDMCHLCVNKTCGGISEMEEGKKHQEKLTLFFMRDEIWNISVSAQKIKETYEKQ